MTEAKEITKILERHYFSGRFFDIHEEDIILNTIKVYEIRDGELSKQIPYDIQVVGEKGYRIIPASPNFEFFVAYYRLVKVMKIEIKSDDYVKKPFRFILYRQKWIC